MREFELVINKLRINKFFEMLSEADKLSFVSIFWQISSVYIEEKNFTLNSEILFRNLTMTKQLIFFTVEKCRCKMTTVWECFGWCWVITHFKAVSWNIMNIFKFKQTWTWAYTCGCTMEQMAFRTQFTWLAIIMLCLWHFIEEFQVEMKGRCRSNW